MKNYKSFNDYVAVNKEDDSHIIGKLMYMTIRKTLIDKDVLVDIIKECEIDEKLLSKRHTYTDPFKQATKTMESTYVVTNDKGEKVKLKIHIRDNKNTSENEIVREIKKEIISEVKNPFIYIGNFRCDKKTGDIDYNINNLQDDGIDYVSLANEVVEYYHFIKDCYTENHIVNFVEKYLEEEVYAASITDIHGKLFFINKLRDEQLMKLEMFIDLVNENNKAGDEFKSKIMSIPVANAEKYRQEYKEQFVKYAKEQLTGIQKHLNRFIKSKQASEKIINAWVEKIKRFKEMEKEFSNTLNKDIRELESSFDIINNQLREIYINIEKKKMEKEG